MTKTKRELEQISTEFLKQKSISSLHKESGAIGLNNRWVALTIMLIGPFLGIIDSFIANIGIPSIQVSLGASFSEIEFMIAGYGLTFILSM